MTKNPKIFMLLLLAATPLIQGCDPQSIAKSAKLECSMDILLDSTEKETCKAGAGFAAAVATESGLTAFSSNQQYKAAARIAERRCESSYDNDVHLLNACYTGIQKFRDQAINEESK